MTSSAVDPTTRNRPGATPFHLAVQNTGRGGTGGPAAKNAQREIIEAMFARNVSPAMKDAWGKTVLDWAKNAVVRELLNT